MKIIIALLFFILSISAHAEKTVEDIIKNDNLSYKEKEKAYIDMTLRASPQLVELSKTMPSVLDSLVTSFKELNKNYELKASREAKLAKLNKPGHRDQNFKRKPFGKLDKLSLGVLEFGVGGIEIGMKLDPDIINIPKEYELTYQGLWAFSDMLPQVYIEEFTKRCNPWGTPLHTELQELDRQSTSFINTKLNSLVANNVGIRSFTIRNGADGYNWFKVLTYEDYTVFALNASKHYDRDIGNNAILNAAKKIFGDPDKVNGDRIRYQSGQSPINFNELGKFDDSNNSIHKSASLVISARHGRQIEFVGVSIDQLSKTFTKGVSKCKAQMNTEIIEKIKEKQKEVESFAL